MISFTKDLRIFAPRIGANLHDVAHQVAAVDRLPTMGVKVGVVEAKSHLLEVATYLVADSHYEDGGIGLHTLSVCTRAMRLAAAFACEDVAAERQGRPCILSPDEWRAVHRAVVTGSSGDRPTLRRNGTFRPARWAVDLIELTGRLAEVGFGPAEAAVRHRAMEEPSREERQAATAHSKGLIRLKEDFLRQHAGLREEAVAWVKFNERHLLPTPRPEGHLDVDGVVHLRMPAMHRTPGPSRAVVEKQLVHEREQAKRRINVVASRVDKPVRVDKECHAILAEARRQAAQFARGAQGGRRALLV